MKKPDVEIRTTDWNPQNIRTLNTEDISEKGVCYGSTKQTWISNIRHIDIQDIINTSIEESIHQAIMSDVTGAPNESENFDIEHEEWVMERIFWAMNDWI